MIIVSDTSPISNLLIINQLDLLRKIFETIVIPEAVAAELKASKSFDASSFLAADWVKTAQLTDRSFFNSLISQLDPGEAEAIALALEMDARLLIDEKKGKQIAIKAGVKIVGVVGMLLTAKDLALIPAMKPLLDDLEIKAGFWLSEKLKRQALELAGENI